MLDAEAVAAFEHAVANEVVRVLDPVVMCCRKQVASGLVVRKDVFIAGRERTTDRKVAVADLHAQQLAPVSGMLRDQIATGVAPIRFLHETVTTNLDEPILQIEPVLAARAGRIRERRDFAIGRVGEPHLRAAWIAACGEKVILAVVVFPASAIEVNVLGEIARSVIAPPTLTSVVIPLLHELAEIVEVPAALRLRPPQDAQRWHLVVVAAAHTVAGGLTVTNGRMSKGNPRASSSRAVGTMMASTFNQRPYSYSAAFAATGLRERIRRVDVLRDGLSVSERTDLRDWRACSVVCEPIDIAVRVDLLQRQIRERIAHEPLHASEGICDRREAALRCKRVGPHATIRMRDAREPPRTA